jgi:energy-converting hydrogenase Eha subunit A
MLKYLENFLIDWKKETTDRQKLQSVYLSLAVLTLVVAGVVALVNAELGQYISYVAGMAFVAYLVNAVVWKLVVDSLVERIKDRRRQVK